MIHAGRAPSGQEFDHWTSEPAGVSFNSVGSDETWFTMPWKDCFCFAMPDEKIRIEAEFRFYHIHFGKEPQKTVIKLLSGRPEDGLTDVGGTRDDLFFIF